MDSLLEPFLAANPEATEKLLGELLVHEVEPIIRKVMLHKLGPDYPDLDDVCAEVLVQATECLRHSPSCGGNCR